MTDQKQNLNPGPGVAHPWPDPPAERPWHEPLARLQREERQDVALGIVTYSPPNVGGVPSPRHNCGEGARHAEHSHSLNGTLAWCNGAEDPDGDEPDHPQHLSGCPYEVPGDDCACADLRAESPEVVTGLFDADGNDTPMGDSAWPSASHQPTDLLLARISQWIDDFDANQGMAAEALMHRRVSKIYAEAGEVADAVSGWLGENPRKGVTHIKAEVIDELLDVAVAALCAVEHLSGNGGLAMASLEEKVLRVAERAGVA